MSFPAYEPPPDAMGGAAPAMQGAPQEGILPARIPEAVDYTVRMSQDRQDALARRLCAEISNARAATERRRNNQRDWKRADKMLPENPLTDEGDEADWHSAARAPFARMARQQHTTRLNSQILSGDPPFGVIGRKATVLVNNEEIPLAEVTPQIEEALTALLDAADWKACARELHRFITRDGAAAVRCTWKRETVWAPVAGLQNFDEERVKLLMEAGVDPQEAYLAGAEMDADGLAKLEVQHEERVLFEGVDLTVIDAEHLLTLPATAKSRKDLWGIGERLTLRGMDLRDGAKGKASRYLKRAVKEMLELHGDNPLTDEDDDEGEFDGVEPQQATMATGDEGKLFQPYNCVELCLLDDLDRSGKLKWYHVGVHLEREKLYRCQYMPYEHGRPFYVPFSYIEDTLTGEAIGELVAVLQDVATRLFNDIVDISRLIAAQGTSLLVDSTMGLDADSFTLTPGSIVDVGNLQGVRDFPLHPAAGQAMQHNLAVLDVLKNWSDLLTASSNPALGKETEGDNTLGEVQIVMGAASQIFEDYATLVALRHAEVADQVRWLAAQYAEGGKVPYRKTASASFEFQDVPREVLLADVDLVPAGLNAFADAQQRLQRDMMVLQTLGAHPLTAQNWELQARLLTQLLQDARVPGWQLIATALQQSAVQMRMQEQMAMMMGAAQMDAEQGAASADQQRAQEAHEDTRAGGQLQRAGQVKELLTPPEKPNGAKKK